MSIAFVLGNGISRRGMPLDNFKQLGQIYGCNLLYTECTPDVLVATDKPIAEHIQKTGYAGKNRFYTRKPLEGLGARTIPKDYYGFSSGPAATALAALDQHRQIYLVGFDIGPTEQKTFNNVFAGREYYKSVGSTPTYTGNWIKQFCKIFGDFPQCNFIRVCGSTTAPIAQFDSARNYKNLSIGTFLERINKQKDL